MRGASGLLPYQEPPFVTFLVQGVLHMACLAEVLALDVRCLLFEPRFSAGDGFRWEAPKCAPSGLQ